MQLSFRADLVRLSLAVLPPDQPNLEPFENWNTVVEVDIEDLYMERHMEL